MTHGARKPDRPTKRFGLNDLATLPANLKADTERREAERLAAKQAAQRAHEEANVFRSSVGQVSQLRDRNHATLPNPRPAPVPVQTQLNDKAVLEASLSDEYDVDMLLE